MQPSVGSDAADAELLQASAPSASEAAASPFKDENEHTGKQPAQLLETPSEEKQKAKESKAAEPNREAQDVDATADTDNDAQGNIRRRVKKVKGKQKAVLRTKSKGKVASSMSVAEVGKAVSW